MAVKPSATDMTIPLPPKDDAPLTMSVTAPTREDLLSRAILSGNVELAKEFMAMQERFEANTARRAFNNAVADAKGGIGVITKSRKVDFTSAKGRTSYSYEDLADIAAAVDPVLAKVGLSYRFRTAQDGAAVTVTCVLCHRDGHQEETTLSASRDDSGGKNLVQQVGSTVTYLQRYTLKAMLGLAAAVDDDAQSVGGGGGGSERVTVEQVAILDDLLKEMSVLRETFCKVMKISHIELLPASKFEEAKKRLEDKRNAANAAG